jgi:hypothetical protein
MCIHFNTMYTCKHWETDPQNCADWLAGSRKATCEDMRFVPVTAHTRCDDCRARKGKCKQLFERGKEQLLEKKEYVKKMKA